MLPALLLALLAAPSDSFEMREIARVPYFPWKRYVCGDADHDGRQEFYAMGVRGTDWCNYILEYAGGGQFDTFPLGYIQAITWDIGDADRDGKTDLLLQYRDSLTMPTLLVLESADSMSMPLKPAWSKAVPGMAFAMLARITDLDADSAREVTFRTVGAYIESYECVAPDSYAYVLGARAGWATAFVQTPDLDRDGLPELVSGDDGGRVYFWESVADDSLVLKDTVRIGSYWFVAALAAAPDMDCDGKPEVIALSVDDEGSGILAVIEAPGNDSFEIVWSTQFPADRMYGNSISIGDLDGDSIPEFVVADGYDFVRLFRCTGNDRYEQFWQTPIFRWGTAALYDINSDGKAELLYHDEADGHWTIIRQYVSLGIAEHQLAELQRVGVGPSVAVRGAPVRIVGLPVKAEVQVLDAAGRVVAKPKEDIWHTKSVPPGAYFIRIRRGNQSITRKVLVLD